MSFNKPVLLIESSLLKRYFIHFHYVLLFIFLLNGIFFYLENKIHYRVFFFIFFCDLFVTLVIYRLDYDIIKPYVNPYLVVVFLFLWYYCLTVWLYNPSVLIYFVLFPFGAYTIFSKKVVIYWSIASISAIVLTVFVIKDLFLFSIPNFNIIFSNIKIVVGFALIFGFIFYYNSLLIRSKYKKIDIQEYEPKDLLSFNDEIEENDFEEKEFKYYNDLYKKIENCLQESASWKDPDYSVQDLAYSLQTNSTYVSRAINLNAKMNFKNFVNTYRIEFIKKEIQNNKDYNRYKLIYLYSQAGFRHQSTFNKVFKKITNMTPSDYIESVNNNNLPFDSIK